LQPVASPMRRSGQQHIAHPEPNRLSVFHYILATARDASSFIDVASLAESADMSDAVADRPQRDRISHIMGGQPVLLDASVLCLSECRRLYRSNLIIPQPNPRFVDVGDALTVGWRPLRELPPRVGQGLVFASAHHFSRHPRAVLGITFIDCGPPGVVRRPAPRRQSFSGSGSHRQAQRIRQVLDPHRRPRGPHLRFARL
jgi:hypothetical protein